MDSPLIFTETEEGAAAINANLPAEVEEVGILKGGDLNDSILYASSCLLAKERTAVVIIETTSEDDRFYKEWLRDATSYMPIREGSELHIVAAVPTVAEAVKDPEWIDRIVSLISDDSKPKARRR